MRGEILYGILHTPAEEKKTALEAEAIRNFQPIPCEILPPRVGDQIVATALALGATLVTRDTDSNDIEGLSVLAIQ